ncbi:hypothetical protein F4859DRAFT_499431 [Xylaria cf. heliscus]|nr:hypothetical protein F4859DRAFT_499431 [Xylaria cf. heliscus]
MVQSHDQDNDCLRLIEGFHEDEVARADVIALHGLHGLHSTFDESWRDRDHDILSPWIRWFPFGTRIYAYDKPMSFSQEHSLLDQSTLNTSAVALLAAISKTIGANRPLVFLCLDIACILVKEVVLSIPTVWGK